MLRLNELSIHLTYNEQEENFPGGKMTFFDELYVDAKLEGVAVPIHGTILRGQRFTLTIHPKQPVQLKKLEIHFPEDYQKTERIFCNGLLSTGPSGEYTPQGNGPAFGENYLLLSRYDETGLLKQSKNNLASWMYSYIRRRNGKLDFIGSLNESTAFTLIQHNVVARQLRIISDCGNLELRHSFPVLDIFVAEGKEEELFDSYFALMNCPPVTAPILLAWQVTKINAWEEYLKQNLALFTEEKVRLNLIWLGKEYAANPGDWLHPQPDIHHVVDTIHRYGYQAGLAIAPFSCSRRSRVFQHYPHWLLHDKQGKPVQANAPDPFGEQLYALDVFHKEVQEYLTQIFFTIFNKWQVDILRLEGLFNACLLPHPEKTRGQMMHEAMELIRNLAGHHPIWADEVPLGSAFGQVAYCGVAPLILQTPPSLLDRIFKQKRSKTFDTLETLMGRWHLNGRAFQSTATNFSLQDAHPFLTREQEVAMLTVQLLLSHLFSTKDDLTTYKPDAWSEWQNIPKWSNSTVTKVESFTSHTFSIHFLHEGDPYMALCNLQKKESSFTYGKQTVHLDPYEVIILKMKN